jgi:DNA-binding transcriptional LysR family regulator
MSNNGDVLRYAALQGVGVLLQPTILVAEEIERGKNSNVVKRLSIQLANGWQKAIPGYVE